MPLTNSVASVKQAGNGCSPLWGQRCCLAPTTVWVPQDSPWPVPLKLQSPHQLGLWPSIPQGLPSQPVPTPTSATLLSQPQVQHFPGTVLDQASPVQLPNVTSGMALPRDHPGSGDQTWEHSSPSQLAKATKYKQSTKKILSHNAITFDQER